MEAAIEEFALHGRDKASLKAIAARCALSVGVVYKYHPDKEGLFNAAYGKCRDELEKVIREATREADSLESLVGSLIDALFDYATRHESYMRLYFRLTEEENGRLASEIEGLSASFYTAFVKRLQDEGRVRCDIEASMLAWLIDSLLTLLQFSLAVPYYRQRSRIYLGPLAEDREGIRKMALAFITAAAKEKT